VGQVKVLHCSGAALRQCLVVWRQRAGDLYVGRSGFGGDYSALSGVASAGGDGDGWSEPVSGSCFVLVLPAAPADIAQNSQLAVSEGALAGAVRSGWAGCDARSFEGGLVCSGDSVPGVVPTMGAASGPLVFGAFAFRGNGSEDDLTSFQPACGIRKAGIWLFCKVV